MKKKVALIFGITGQDGSYLTEFLLNKNYFVFGVKRRTSLIHTTRIDHIYEDRHLKPNLILKYGDVTDFSNVFHIISETNPDEIYNLAAQSNVGVSFELPEYTAQTDSIGTLRILEAIRILDKKKKKIKFYQASSSEMFGKARPPQNEKTIFQPRSVYAISKIFAFNSVVHYREAYNLHSCNGILFNHESPRRGVNFVTRKIIQGLIRIKKGEQKILTLGNLYARRDWGHAKDYVESMWKILQNKKADDFVIATKKSYSVKDFVNISSKKLGFKIKWKNSGLKEVGIDTLTNKIIVNVSKKYFRETEVDNLIGDFSKAKKLLNWKPKKSLIQLIDDMIINEK